MPPLDTALILCAGLGTRMENLTVDTPKPLLSIWGKSILDHTLTKLLKTGIRKIIVNTHYLPDQIHAHLIPWKHYLHDLVIFHESSLKGTGGSIVQACEFTQGKSFFVLNGDLLWKEKTVNPLAQMMHLWQEEKTPMLALVPKERAFGYDGPGDFFEHEGRVIQKTNRHQEAPYVFAGLQIFDPFYASKKMTEEARLSLPFAVNALWSKPLSAHLMRSFIFPEPWYHVGTKASFQRLCYA